jgi:single-strand DNA-binding protein
MSGINKVILVGNLGKDPEVRYLEGGTAVAKFPLATSETYKNKEGQKVDSTEWHNIVMWRGLAEIAEKFLKKGSLVYIEGKIRTRAYDDKEGNKRYATEIIADSMTMLGRRTDETSHTTTNTEFQKQTQETPSVVPASNEQAGGDDLPF